MWDCHFKSAVSVTPNCRVDFTCSVSLSLMVSGGMSGGVLLKQMRSSIVIECHFVGRLLGVRPQLRIALLAMLTFCLIIRKRDHQKF